MSNEATLVSTGQIRDRITQEVWNVSGYRLDIDTVAEALEIVEADDERYIGVFGVTGLSDTALDSTWLSGSEVLSLSKYDGHQGKDYRLGPVLLWAEKGQPLKYQSSVTVTGLLVFVIKYPDTIPNL